MVGVYKITNTINGKVYIGEGISIIERWSSHIRHLEKGEHHSKDLQIDYDKYGIENFKFEVIQKIDENLQYIVKKCLLYILENQHIKKYDSINNGYNSQNTLGLVLNTKMKFKTDQEIMILKNIIKIFNKNNKTYSSKLISEIEMQLKDQLEQANNLDKKEEIKEEKIKQINNNPNSLYSDENINIFINSCKNYEFAEEFIKLMDVLNGVGCYPNKVYEILRNTGILDNKNVCKINDESMFKVESKIYIDKNTNIERNYCVTYISRKGLKHILRKIIEYAQNNNINIFTKKYIKDNLIIS